MLSVVTAKACSGKLIATAITNKLKRLEEQIIGNSLEEVNRKFES